MVTTTGGLATAVRCLVVVIVLLSGVGVRAQHLPHDLGTIPDFATFPGAVVVGPGRTLMLPADAPLVIVVTGGTVKCPTIGPVRLTTLMVKTGSFLCQMTGEIIIRDQPIDLARDPEQWGHGILAIGGQVRLQHPAVRTPKVKLLTEALAGQTTILLEEPPQGWLVGDIAVIPDTRQLMAADIYKPVHNWRRLTDQEERRPICAIDGAAITLCTALTFDHRGARGDAGQLVAHPDLGNVTRGLTIRSEHSSGVRGHFLCAHLADCQRENVAFVDMGRTTADALNPATNHIGRYADHNHHQVGPPSIARGIAIVDGGKWCTTIHNSHGVTLENSIIVGCRGSGIAFETGTESNVTIRRNFIMKTNGSITLGEEDETDFGAAGSGLWAAALGDNVRIEDNVFADGNSCVQFPQQSTGTFARNECYGHLTGATLWGAGLSGAPAHVDDMTIWHFALVAMTFQNAKDLIINRPHIHGDGSKEPWLGIGSNVGVSGSVSQFRMTDPDITQVGYGVDLQQPGYSQSENKRVSFSIEGGRISADTQIQHTRSWPGVAADEPTVTFTVRDTLLVDTFKGTRYGASDKVAKQIVLAPQPRYQSWTDQTLAHRFTLINYQRQAGANLELFHPEQLPSAPMPTTGTWTSPAGLTFEGMIGVTEAGLTNQQSLEKFGVAFMGQLAPCATPRVGLTGLFACPIGNGPPGQDRQRQSRANR